MYLHPTKQEARIQKRILLWKSIFTTLAALLSLVKEVWLSLDLHMLSSHFNLSCPPPCQQSHFCEVKMKCGGKKRLGPSLSFFFFFLLLSCLYKGWMKFQCSCIPTCFPIASAGLHCLHCHQIGKGCKKRWCCLGNEAKKSNIRQNYVTKLKFEIIRNS